MSENRVLCPACGKDIAVKGIPKHTNGCPKWGGFSKVPPSEFDFDRYYKRKLWADGLVPGEDYVECALCPIQEFRAVRLADHLRHKHQMTVGAYQDSTGGAPVVALASLRQREKTVQEKYGVANVAKAPEIRKKLVENSRAMCPEAKNKRGITNLARYGHENVLGGEGGKIRAQGGMKVKYGVANPQQVSEIRERTVETSLERYGAPCTFETEGYQERYQEISQERFGTDHPMLSEEGKERCFQAVQKAYGVDTVFALPEIQTKCYTTNLANHGGVHSQQCPDILAKAQATWLEKYGVDNPSKCEEVKCRIKDVWMGKYGVPFPPQSLWMNQTHYFPNKLEQTVIRMVPAYVVYSGDGSYWVRHQGASRSRNPDFVVLTPEQLDAYRAGTPLNSLRTWRIAEIFGDYWHSKKFTGVDRVTHQREVEEFYRKAGITCLVLWEGEIKSHPRIAAERLLAFLEGSSQAESK